MSESYVMSRRERKKLDCKYAILRAARELFMERGPDVPVEDIANRADISYPTFFNYFPTKAALYYAIYLEEIEDLREFIGLELTDEPSAARKIRRIFDEIMKDFVRYRYLDLHIAGEVARRNCESGSHEQISVLFMEAIDSGRSTGEFREDIDPRNYAMLIAGIIFSTSFYSCEESDYHDMLSLLLDSMRTR